MTSDVVLTAALRNNLLSLQGTQKAIDKTQLNLATGRKINSALDGPASFFASQALNNRASDLTRLLDSIGQSIQVIKTADNGVTALTTLVEQADSLAANARDALAAGQAEAKVVGDRDLRGVDDLTTLSGIDNTTETYQLVFRLTDNEGVSEGIGTYGAGTASTVTITINALDSIDDLMANINDIHVDDGNGNANGAKAFEASLDAGGRLQIKSLNGGDFSVEFVTGTDADTENLGLANALGFGNIARLVASDGSGNNDVKFTALSDVALRSFNMTYTDADGNEQTALRSTLLTDLNLSDATPLFANIDDTADLYVISINGGTQETIALGRDIGGTVEAVTLQDFIDGINDNDNLSKFIRADFDEATGQVTISAISRDVQSIEIGVEDAVTANFGFGISDNPDDATGLTGAAGEQDVETIRLASAAATLAQLESDYNRVRDQITELVTNGDTAYRGTNLLNGDDLLTVFNEHRTSTLTSKGVTFTADGLGLSEANFSRVSSVEGSIAQARDALEAIRAFGSTLANDLTIIQTREAFTQNTINTLTEGADKLTIADQNAEGAKLLALQTRQQLAVTSLALASQSQQSILRLF